MKKYLLTLCAIGFVIPVLAQPRLNKDNIDQVLKAMTLEEKATLTVGSGWGSMIAGITGGSKILVPGAAGTTQAIDRLGIPRIVLSDGPAGLRIDPERKGDPKTYYCTGYPIGSLLACTWDTDLVSNVTKSMGNEVKEYGVDVLLGPGMNLHRNPLNGRNFEYYSEDPLLSGKIAAAYIEGIQSDGVGVSVKHFVCNNQETNRMSNDVIINKRALRELYLKAFEIAIREARPWTIMSSYNLVNGSPTQEDKALLTTLLRDEWGYGGIVMTDWTGKRNTVAQIEAGNDLMEPGDPSQTQEIIDNVKNGTLKEADLDKCVRRILELVVKTPRFNGYEYSDKPDLKAHAQIARSAASQGMVLLKNDNGTLPFKGVGKIALFGATSIDFVAGGTGSGNVNKAYVANLEEGLENGGYTLDKDLADYYKSYVSFARQEMKTEGNGAGILLGDAKVPDKRIPRSFIDRQVEGNDVAIVLIGRNSGEGLDRKVDNDFNLSDAERQLLTDVCDAFHQASKKVVVVLNVGGVIETYSWKNLPDAILLAWQPGQEGGNAVADILGGKVDPSGKLAMTFPISYMDHPSSLNFPYDAKSKASFNPFMSYGGKTKTKNVDYTDYSEGIWVGYRYFSTIGGKVSYPFGYGLSYTSFSFSKPMAKVEKNGGFTASVTVTNIGKVSGKKVVELYVSAPEGGLAKPVMELKAFAKTKDLAPGESETVNMKVDPYSLASFNEDKNEWETASGTYIVKFANDASDIVCEVRFKEAKGQVWPVHDILGPEKPLQEISLKR